MGGYSLTIDTIMGMAQTCYDVAEQYSGITSRLARIDVAAHLTDERGEPTEADREILSHLQEFENYLRTTTSRYTLAADNLAASARTYVEVEDVGRDTFESYDIDEFDTQWDTERGAQDTHRPDVANDRPADGFGTEENPERTEQEIYEDGKEYGGWHKMSSELESET